jgi:glutathione S-transferase
MNERTVSLVLCELASPAEAGLESYSPFCLKVHRALQVAGLAYTSRHASRPAEHRAHNAAAQVPVLLVDGAPIADSTEIVRYVASRAPERLGASAEAWLWEDWADTALNGFVVASRWADERNWPAVRDAYFGKAPWFVRTLIAPMLRKKVQNGLVARDVWRAGAAACWARFERILDALEERAPASGFWVGDGVSVADVAIYGQVRSLLTSLTVPQAEAVRARPTLLAYVGRVDELARGRAAASETASVRFAREPMVLGAAPAQP